MAILAGLAQPLANLFWDALKFCAGNVHDWSFDPRRAAGARMRDRQRWWTYKLKAEQTQDKRDDMRAEWFRIRFNFNVDPETALKRGDLDPQTRQLATDAMERARATQEWQGPAADRAKP